jgi:hypothetical protein
MAGPRRTKPKQVARKKAAGKPAGTKTPAKRAQRGAAGRAPQPRAMAKPKQKALAPPSAARPARGVGAAAPMAVGNDLAKLLEEANENFNALLALEPRVPPADRPQYLRARSEARRARARLELAQLEALLDEQQAALPELVARSRQLKEDLANAQTAVAVVAAISAALSLFGDILALLA